MEKHPRKEEAFTSRSRAAPPPVAAPPPEPLGAPAALFADRGFLVEHTVDVLTLMREDLTEWGLTYLATAGLQSLLVPPDLGYPWITRLFYSTFRYYHMDGAGPSHCHVTIDGLSFRIGSADIAAALHFPPTNFVNHIPCVSFEQIIRTMCDGQHGSGHSTRRSYLPERLWIVDHILYRNLCPIGHKSERRDEFL